MDTKIETNVTDIKNNEDDEFIDSDIDDIEIELSEHEEEIEEDEEEDDEEEDDEEDEDGANINIKDIFGEQKENKSETIIIHQQHGIVDTVNRLTIFEATRIIAERAAHLEAGAVPYIDITDMTSAIEIAHNEYINKKIPFILHRKIGDNLIESIPIHELELCVEFDKTDIIPNH